jgi:hypothetical protein
MKNKKETRKGAPSRVSDTLKLLFSFDQFLADIKIIRKNFDIPLNGFEEGKDCGKWLHNLAEKTDLRIEEILRDQELRKLWQNNGIEYRKRKDILINEAPLNKYRNTLKDLVKKYTLPFNLLDAIELFILYNKPSVIAPSSNFSLSMNPEARKNTAEYISIKAYAPLTEKEIKIATEMLRSMQKHYLPKSVSRDIKTKHDVDKMLEIEAEMKKRLFKRTESYTDYLALLKKSYDRGDINERQFKETKKKHLHDIKIEEKYTSREISKIFFGSHQKAYLVRQICSRLAKERKIRFGKV